MLVNLLNNTTATRFGLEMCILNINLGITSFLKIVGVILTKMLAYLIDKNLYVERKGSIKLLI